MTDFDEAKRRLESCWTIDGAWPAGDCTASGSVHREVRLLLAEVERLQAEIDRPKHGTLRQLADVVERYDAMKGRAEKAEAELAAGRLERAERLEQVITGLPRQIPRGQS